MDKIFRLEKHENRMQKHFFQVKSFIVIVKRRDNDAEPVARKIKKIAVDEFCVYTSQDSRIEIAFTLRKGPPGTEPSMSTGLVSLLLGDDSEWQESQGNNCMANAAIIEIDLKEKDTNILSSIVGLPAVFVYQSSDLTIITSDIYLLTLIPGLSLYFDSTGIQEMCSIGHPTDCRTLYKNVSMVPSGSSTTINENGEVRTRKVWNLPEESRLAGWEVFTDLQIDAFKKAINNLNLSKSFLSLTAGLDTRTILAAIVQNKLSLPAYTMSGKTLSLDARTSRSLCNAYGLSHTVIEIDKEFYDNLSDYILEASRLSGGLTALDQAHEVYFYKKVEGSFNARLSGNLGNQIGRRGTEKISMRNADRSILSEDIVSSGNGKYTNHWYENVETENGDIDYQFLIEKEIPFSSVANYCIGNYYAIQQSPYANRRLIELTQLMPKRANDEKQTSVFKMRIKDLRHRFFGESENYSFQVKYIKNVDGVVATYPINWGWRAKGGVSLVGIFYGGLSFADAVFTSRAQRSKTLHKILEATKIAGLHEYVHTKSTLDSMRDFNYDMLLSTPMNATNIFDRKCIEKILHEHYSLTKFHYKTISVALDIACAQKVFHAQLPA
jgi:hypothetical protein